MVCGVWKPSSPLARTRVLARPPSPASGEKGEVVNSPWFAGLDTEEKPSSPLARVFTLAKPPAPAWREAASASEEKGEDCEQSRGALTCCPIGMVETDRHTYPLAMFLPWHITPVLARSIGLIESYRTPYNPPPSRHGVGEGGLASILDASQGG